MMQFVAFLAPLVFVPLPARATFSEDGLPVYYIAKLRRDGMKYRGSQLSARLSRCHRVAHPVPIYP
ncbi:MAG: hypothetical protein M5R41_02035 [Bacteroidia bacterium]|nr:hypothetical protein [Bacteroidia bacterium]